MIEGNITVGIPTAKQPTLAEVIHYLEGEKQLASGDIAECCKDMDRPEDKRIFENHAEEMLDMAIYQYQCLSFAITKLKGEEEYAAKMLDGAHARMELARQMNEQGEL